MNKSESIKNVIGALIKVQSQMKNVIKDSKNPFFKSNYADINALREELLPLLADNSLVVLQSPTHKEGKNFIETTVYHDSGEYISSLNEVIVAKQNDPQAYLAAQTYTRRGALQAMFCMGAVDDDGNYASGKTDKQETFKKEYVAKPVQSSVSKVEVKTEVKSEPVVEKKGFGKKVEKVEIKVEESDEGWD